MNISQSISDRPAHSDLYQQINPVILGGKEKTRSSQARCCLVTSSAVAVPAAHSPPNLRDAALQPFLLGQGHHCSQKLNSVWRSSPVCETCGRKGFSGERAPSGNLISGVIAEMPSVSLKWPQPLPGTITQRLSVMNTPFCVLST